jgi:hypothetical protein
MKHAHRHRWLSWLLPLIVVRMLVPAGFMLSAGEHGVYVVPCSGFGPGFTREARDAAHGHHRGDHTQPQHDGGDNASSSTICLFAVATAACAGAGAALDSGSFYGGQTVGSRFCAVNSAEPFLPDRIRGPPLV